MIGDDYSNDGTAIHENSNDDDSVSGAETVIKSEHDDDNSKYSDHDDENSADTSTSKPKPHDETESDEEGDIVGNPKLQRELQKLTTFYNPTVDDLGDVALVGGTDELY